MEQKNEENCVDCVMRRIKEERITPRSKWRFLFNDLSVLAISASSLIIGTLSFSVFLETLLTDDWDIYNQAGRTFWENVLKNFPFLWLFFLCIFIFYSYYAFSESERGYRYKQSVVISLCIAISLILGVFSYFAGIGEKVDNYLIANVPSYHSITGNHVCLWLQPDRGLLAGMIISTGTKPIIIVDFQGNRWIATGTPVFSRGAIDRPGERVKILGTAQGNYVFEAKELRRWSGVVEPNPCR
ncbi:MAG: hypothetical protein WCT49_00965 [Candidatus Paceibacterota bacterium]|jgi:hypothetical protein|nr:hypothetical protein [Candidatus Paceibacterota bacterium]